MGFITRAKTLSEAANTAKCYTCGAKALTIAPVHGKESMFVGACAKHPETVQQAMRKLGFAGQRSRERKMDSYRHHQAVATAGSSILKENRKKTY